MALKVKAVERNIKFTKDENDPGVLSLCDADRPVYRAEPGKGKSKKIWKYR